MEVEKRKRKDVGEIDGKRMKVSEDNGGVTTTEPEEDEVEEFFAILRRIHKAVKYFEKGNGGEGGTCSRELTTAKGSSSLSWSPSFQREDFEKVDGVKGPVEVEEDAGLDLNADPESDDQNSS